MIYNTYLMIKVMERIWKTIFAIVKHNSDR